MFNKQFSRLIRLSAILSFSFLSVSCGSGSGPTPVAGQACPDSGLVSFGADSYASSAASAAVLLDDACIGLQTVAVLIDNGNDAISIDVELDKDGKGSLSVAFGATSDEADTIAISDGDVLTAKYKDANGNNQTDTADITNVTATSLGVYSETNTDPVLPVGNITSATGGKVTTIDDASTAVTAFDGSVVLQTDFLSTGAGGSFNGFIFDFNPPLMNVGFEADDASGGNVSGATGWTTFETVFTNNTAGPGFGPVSHDAGGTQSLTMFGPFVFDGAAGAFQPDNSVVGGSVYTATAHVMNWDGDNLAPDNIGIFQLSFWDAPGGQNGGGNQLGVSEIIVDASDDGNNVFLAGQDGADISDWTAISITEIAPVGTQSAEIFLLHIQLSTPAAGGSIFWDDISLVKGASADAERGKDVSAFEFLRFAINTSASAGLMDLEIKLEDTAAGASSVFLSNYTATPSAIAGWDVYDIPLADFPAGVDLTKVISLGYFNPSSTVTGSTATAPTLFDTTLYFDDVHFATGAAAAPTVLTGLFIDAAVQGVTYQTATQSGVTNALGEFNYLAGEMVTFSIGGIVIGVVEGAPMITPVEMTGSVDPTDEEATNLLVFLQSIDADADHSNGITISAATQAAAVGQTLDFTEPGFTNQVTSVVAAIEDPADPDNSVVTDNAALTNFYDTYVELGGTDTVTWLFPGFPPVPEVAVFELVWSDEFNVDGAPDPENWLMETGYGDNGWGNNEWQLYTDSSDNVKVEGGNLVITADCPTAPTCGVRNGTVTSARINTLNRFSFKYGKLEARIKAPVGEGAWPAFWMLGKNFPEISWPRSGEIDIMELHNFFSDENTTHFTIHFCDDFVSSNPCLFDPGHTFISDFLTLPDSLGDDFHIYSTEWDENEIVGKIDGTEYYRQTINPANMDEFLKEFFMILNVAMGGTLGSNGQPPNGTETWPQVMLVDYVRLYQEVGGNGTSTVGGPVVAPLEPLGVYSETNVDPVLAVTEIINVADFGGKNTVTDTNSSDVALEGSVSLKADYISGGAGSDFNGFVFNFGSAAGGNLLLNGGFESADASAGDLPTVADWSKFEAVFTNSTNGPAFGPVSHDAGGTQSIKMFGPFVANGAAGAFQSVDVTAGESYDLTAYAMSWNPDPVGLGNVGILQLSFWDGPGASGNQVGGNIEFFVDSDASSSNTTLAPQDGAEISDWTQMTASGVAPAGAVSAKAFLLHIQSGAGNVGGSIFFDDVNLTTTPIPGSDISGYETLKFGINTSAASGLADLEVKLETSSNSVSVFLSAYTPTPTVGTNGTWDVYEIPLSDFTGLDLTDIVFLGFWNASSTVTGSTMVAPTLLNGSVYFDDIHFKLGLPVILGPNLLLNGGFESADASGGDLPTVADWSKFEAVFTNSTIGPAFGPVSHDVGGTQSIKMFGPFVANGAAGAFQSADVTAGETYDLNAYVMSWNPDPVGLGNVGILQLSFWDGPGATGNQVGGNIEFFVDSDASSSNTTLAPQDGAEISDWTLMTVSGVAPAGAVSAKAFLLHIQSGAGNVGGSIFFDDVSLRAR